MKENDCKGTSDDPWDDHKGKPTKCQSGRDPARNDGKNIAVVVAWFYANNEFIT